MRSICILLCLAPVVSLAPAQPAPAEKGSLLEPPPQGFRFDRDIPYGEGHPAQKLDILYREAAETPAPAIVFVHGGGWRGGDKNRPDFHAMMREFAEDGYVTLSLNYRLSGDAPFPAAVHDCKRAIRWTRAHAAKYGVDPARFGAVGGSAGGHLVGMLAVTGPDAGLEGPGYEEYSSAVQAAVPVCGPFDLTAHYLAALNAAADPAVAALLGGSALDKPELARQASPITHVSAGDAPMLLIHGTADERVGVEHSKKMAKACASAGVDCRLILVEGAGHGMGICRQPEQWAAVRAYFDEKLKSERATEQSQHASE